MVNDSMRYLASDGQDQRIQGHLRPINDRVGLASLTGHLYHARLVLGLRFQVMLLADTRARETKVSECVLWIIYFGRASIREVSSPQRIHSPRGAMSNCQVPSLPIVIEIVLISASVGLLARDISLCVITTV